MASETVVTPPTPGGGRMLDMVWPSRRVTGWGAVSTNIDIRNGAYVGNLALATAGRTVNGTQAYAVYQGVDCVKMTAPATVGQGTGYISNDLFRLHVRTTKGHGIPARCSDFATYRTYASMAFPYVPAQDSDMGLELCPQSDGTNGAIFSDAKDGIGITRGADGHVYLAVRGGGVLHKYALDGAAGFDPTLFHSYELLITSATKSSEATLKCLVDGTLVQTLSWGAGTVLPVSNNANPGFYAGMWALEGNAGYHYVESWRVMYGPSEQATL